MRLSSLFQLSVLITSSLARKFAAGTPEAESWTRYNAHHSKSLSSSAPPRLDDKSFGDLTQSPRSYYVVALLTALPAQFGCALCKQFQPEFDLLGKSWVNGDKNLASSVVFGTLDFPDNKGTFQKLALQTAPVLLLYPPTTGPNAKPEGQPLRLDFSQGPRSAEEVHGWLSRNIVSDVKPPVRRPFNYVKFATITTLVLGGISFLTLAGPYLGPVLQSRNLWAGLSLIAVLLFTSGHMFNHIRHVPYVSGDGKGGIQYFAAGFQSQWGMETQIVAGMYAILSFATISLALKVPRMADSKRQGAAVMVWSLIMLGMYSFLLSVFRVKNGGYPFWLPPF